jgi:iron(III) transport system ATP-binding protein
MTTIALSNIAKHYGRTVAIESVDLTIEDGELFFLLGPSGCGKTTLLRLIAGFHDPTAGTIRFGDRDVTHLAPNRRNTGMVFQSYALWPHLTVFDNVAYGLNVRRVRGDERARRVREALALVQMSDYAKRKPNQLSGGQQQRVALARALVIEPDVLLLDEPLSNLDAKLRLDMRTEIRRICTEAAITTVYVTHDQKEALSMADRVAVLHQGVVAQVGSPRKLYERPASRFVAEFLGETNFLSARVEGREDGAVVLDTPAGRLRSTAVDEDVAAGASVTCSLRPEALRLRRDGEAGNVLSGLLKQHVYLGEMAQHRIELADGSLVKALELNPRPFDELESTVRLVIDPADVVVLPLD